MNQLLQRIPLWLLPVIGGTLIGFGWHPYPLFPLIFIGLYCFFRFSYFARKPNKMKFGSLYLGFLVFNLISTSWLFNASLEGGLLAIFLNSLFMAIMWYIPIRFFKSPLSRVLFTIGIYSLFELFHMTHWDLSWPWLTFGFSLANQTWLIQWYEFTGPLVGTLWIFAAVAIWLIHCKAILKVSVFLIPALLSIFIYTTKTDEVDQGASIQIGVIQPNTDPYLERYTGQDNFIPYYKQFQTLIALTDSCKQENSSLVLWPETSIPSRINELKLERSTFIRRACKQGISIIAGASSYKILENETSNSRPLTKGDGFYENYNSAFLMNKEGVEIYHKSRLVPGVEKSPFRKILSFLDDYTIDFGGSTGTLGHENSATVWTIHNKFKIAPLVCYESIYPDYIGQFIQNGANILTVITNDGWWGNTAGYQQHFAISRVMAITFRRQVARSAYTGISGFINERGDILKASNYDEQTFLTESIYPNSRKTFYAKFPYLIHIILIAIFIGGAIYVRKQESN